MSSWGDIPTIISTLQSATDIAKAVAAAGGTLDKAEMKFKLADLMLALADARSQMAGMQETLDRLENELRDTKKKLAFAGTMVYHAPYYVNEGGADRGPYCGTCWDAERLAIHLIEHQRGFWYCKRCDQHVEDDTVEIPQHLDPDSV